MSKFNSTKSTTLTTEVFTANRFYSCVYLCGKLGLASLGPSVYCDWVSLLYITAILRSCCFVLFACLFYFDEYVSATL